MPSCTCRILHHISQFRSFIICLLQSQGVQSLIRIHLSARMTSHAGSGSSLGLFTWVVPGKASATESHTSTGRMNCLTFHHGPDSLHFKPNKYFNTSRKTNTLADLNKTCYLLSFQESPPGYFHMHKEGKKRSFSAKEVLLVGFYIYIMHLVWFLQENCGKSVRQQALLSLSCSLECVLSPAHLDYRHNFLPT